MAAPMCDVTATSHLIGLREQPRLRVEILRNSTEESDGTLYNTQRRISTVQFHHFQFKNSNTKRDPEGKILLLNLQVIRFPSLKYSGAHGFQMVEFSVGR